MILKIWNDDTGGWIYFGSVEKISTWRQGPLSQQKYKGDYNGGVYIKEENMQKEMFIIALLERTQDLNQEVQNIRIAFSEGYLLGDDGKTIERL